MASSKWPPALKCVIGMLSGPSGRALTAHLSSSVSSNREFVNETFAKCTDANRAAVEAELKQAIYKAFESGTMWSTDWKQFKLERWVKRGFSGPRQLPEPQTMLTNPSPFTRSLNPTKKRK